MPILSILKKNLNSYDETTQLIMSKILKNRIILIVLYKLQKFKNKIYGHW